MADVDENASGAKSKMQEPVDKILQDKALISPVNVIKSEVNIFFSIFYSLLACYLNFLIVFLKHKLPYEITNCILIKIIAFL